MSSNLSQSLNVYGTQGDTYTTLGSSTNVIDASGKYLQYNLTQGNLNTFSGKTIEMEFDSLPTSGAILDLGDNLRITKSSTHYFCLF